MKTFGVLTGSDASFYRSLSALVESCEENNFPIAIIDHGLTLPQVNALRDRALIISGEHHRYEKSIDQVRREQGAYPLSATKAWFKPLACLDSPFDHTVWIDADALIVNGGETLKQHTLEGAWLTPDYYIPKQRTRNLYGALIRAIYGNLPSSFLDHCWVNNGVFGFSKGDAWLSHWLDMTEYITNDASLLKLCVCRDQSALVAWLASGNPLSPRIITDKRLNYPANNSSVLNRKRKAYPIGIDLLNEAKKDHPNAYVVHWMARPKPDNE
jgi:hypothetical protein